MKAINFNETTYQTQVESLSQALSHSKSVVGLLRHYFHMVTKGQCAIVNEDILACTQWNAETLLDTAKSAFDSLPITNDTPTDELNQYLLQASSTLKLWACNMDAVGAHGCYSSNLTMDILRNIETLISKAESLVLDTKEWHGGSDE